MNNKINIQEAIDYHLKNDISFYESQFRIYSKAYFECILEAKKKHKNKSLYGGYFHMHPWDNDILDSDIGEVGISEGKMVPLDIPIPLNKLEEAEYKGKDVDLNKPSRNSEGKKFKVYVKDPKTGNIKKVTFGAKEGGGNLAVKLNNPKAKRNFANRHDCENKNDKTKPSYWSCRLPRYAKTLGLSGGGKWW